MHDIIVRFPSKEMADYFITQVSDFSDLSPEMSRVSNTDGRMSEDFEEVFDEDRPVFSISSISDFSEPSRWPDENYITFGEMIRNAKAKQ